MPARNECLYSGIRALRERWQLLRTKRAGGWTHSLPALPQCGNAGNAGILVVLVKACYAETAYVDRGHRQSKGGSREDHYRRIPVLLERAGWRGHLKRVHRLWTELGLRRPVRRSKARKLGPKPGMSANRCVNQPARFKNDVWTYDFMLDRTVSGKTLTWLTLVDEYTRENLAVSVASSLTGAAVRRVLARVLGRRGAPRRLRSGQGSEFMCESLRGLLPSRGAASIPVAAGSPWANGYSASFHSRFRDAFLECEEFESVPDAPEKGEWFRRALNTVRPHSSLDYKTPKQFSDECDRGEHGQPPERDKETIELK